MSDVQAILYYSFKIYESESERKNILIVPVYIANEWVFSTKIASSSKQEAAAGKRHPCTTPESLSLFFGKTVNPSPNNSSRVSQKLHRNPIPVRVKNGHRDGDDWRVNERKDSSIVAVFTDEIVLAVRKQKAKEKHRGNEEEKDSNFLVRRH